MSETTTSEPPNKPTLTIAEGVERRVGFGTTNLAGPGLWDAPRDPEQAIMQLRNVIHAGVTHIDTSDAYGPGTAESLIRKGLFPYPDDLVIATKGGLVRPRPGVWAPCGRPDYLRQSVEMSLRRLRVEGIHIYYLNRIDPAVHFEDQLAVLSDLQAEGKIVHVGLAGASEKYVREADGLITVAAVHHKYNVANRAQEGLLDYCEKSAIPFVACAPLSNGRLAARNTQFGLLADAYQTTPAQLALAWLLHRSPVITPVGGTTSGVHLNENLAAVQVKLSAEDMATISDAGADRFDLSLL